MKAERLKIIRDLLQYVQGESIVECVAESMSKSTKIREQIQIQEACNPRHTCAAYKVPPRFVVIILMTLTYFRSDSAVSHTIGSQELFSNRIAPKILFFFNESRLQLCESG